MGAPKGNQYALGNKGGRPLKYTVEEIDKKIAEFWAYIERTGYIPTLERLNAILDCDKELLNQYEDREEYADSIKRVKRGILAGKVEHLHVAKNPAGTIFDLKNNHGWIDKQEIDTNIAMVSFGGEVDLPN